MPKKTNIYAENTSEEHAESQQATVYGYVHAERMIYTVKEVSRILHTNPAFIYRLIELGLLPALKLCSIRVRKDALDTFLREHEGEDLSDPLNIKKLVNAG